MEFHICTITQIPGAENVEVNKLSKCASAIMRKPESVEAKTFIEYLPKKSQPISAHQFLSIQVNPAILYWMHPIINYINDQTLPKDRNEARRLMY